MIEYLYCNNIPWLAYQFVKDNLVGKIIKYEK